MYKNNCISIICLYLKEIQNYSNQDFLENALLPFFISFINFLDQYGKDYEDLLHNYNIVEKFRFNDNYSETNCLSDSAEFVNKFFEEYLKEENVKLSKFLYEDLVEIMYYFYEWLFYSNYTNYRVLLIE